MTRHPHALRALAALLLAAGAARADNCEPIRERIAERIRAGGVASFTLETVDAAASAAGRTVGRCDLGRKRIVYRAGSGASATQTPPAARRDDRILTECKDGSVSVGGNCRK